MLNKGQIMSCSLKYADYMSFQKKFHVGNYTSQSSKSLQEQLYPFLQSTEFFVHPPSLLYIDIGYFYNIGLIYLYGTFSKKGDL